MRGDIFCCLLLSVLDSQVTADSVHKAVNETQPMTLPCRHSVKNKGTWSVERGGTNVDILTVDGDNVIRHIKDPDKHYNSLADKSLFIVRVKVSDSGKYFCNNELMVELTVIPSGTKIQNVEEGDDTSLKCPSDVGSQKPTWSRETAGKQKHIRSPVSAEDKMLHIRNVQIDDFGLYFCDGEAAVYLNVTGEGRSYTAATPPEKQQFFLVRAGIGAFIVLTISVFFVTWRCRSKKQDKQPHVYDEIPDVTELQPTNGGSNQDDPTYWTIPDLLQSENKTDSPQLNDGTYFLLEKPNELEKL